MRDFFISEMETLKIKTGLNQYENISALPDAEHQFKLLFDSLEDVCAQYQYIPDNDKKRIVQEQIYRDQDFNQLTPRVLWKWLEREKGKYFREAAHVDGVCPVCNQQVNPECNNTFHQRANAKSVSYEELSPATKAAWDAYMKSLQSDDAGFKRVPEVTQKEIDDIKIEDLEEREGHKSIIKPRPEWVIGKQCPSCNGRGFISDPNDEFGETEHARDCNTCKGIGEINLVRIHADTEQEARKMYNDPNNKMYINNYRGI